METKIFTDDISEAAGILRAGGLVAVPTETVYGLAANGFDAEAVSEIFAVKGRPENKPLSLMVPDSGAMAALCSDVPKAAYTLADIFWPGPLTLVLKAKAGIPEIVRAGGETIGLRCPDHPQLQALLRQIDFPLAAPSANPSGEKSPVSAQEVDAYFNGRIAGIIDGGVCAVGKESTLIDLSKTPYTVLREGALSKQEIFMALSCAMTIIGVTGGTGCGKTTALKAIKEMGGLVIDCDEVYHRLLSESPELIEAVNRRFPGAIDKDTRDTKALGGIVFSSAEDLSALNAITHKFVGDEISRQIFDWAAQGGEIVAVDAIALIESGMGNICKATVGIIAPEERRIERLMKREGISREYAALRISAQKPNEFFEENCDYTVSNDETEESFLDRCRQTFIEIIRR